MLQGKERTRGGGSRQAGELLEQNGQFTEDYYFKLAQSVGNRVVQRMVKDETISREPVNESTLDMRKLTQLKVKRVEERVGAQKVDPKRLLKKGRTCEFEQKLDRANKTGLPDRLKSGLEHLSGMDLDDIKVHYNSKRPRALSAHAITQGTDIHIASGQEKHLAHEAWHVVQQKQGRVKPTTQVSGVAVNDSVSLEKEADLMGARAMQVKPQPSKSYSRSSITPMVKNINGRRIMQRKIKIGEKLYEKKLSDMQDFIARLTNDLQKAKRYETLKDDWYETVFCTYSESELYESQDTYELMKKLDCFNLGHLAARVERRVSEKFLPRGASNKECGDNIRLAVSNALLATARFKNLPGEGWKDLNQLYVSVLLGVGNCAEQAMISKALLEQSPLTKEMEVENKEHKGKKDTHIYTTLKHNGQGVIVDPWANEEGVDLSTTTHVKSLQTFKQGNDAGKESEESGLNQELYGKDDQKCIKLNSFTAPTLKDLKTARNNMVQLVNPYPQIPIKNPFGNGDLPIGKTTFHELVLDGKKRILQRQLSIYDLFDYYRPFGDNILLTKFTYQNNPTPFIVPNLALGLHGQGVSQNPNFYNKSDKTPFQNMSNLNEGEENSRVSEDDFENNILDLEERLINEVIQIESQQDSKDELRIAGDTK